MNNIKINRYPFNGDNITEWRKGLFNEARAGDIDIALEVTFYEAVKNLKNRNEAALDQLKLWNEDGVLVPGIPGATGEAIVGKPDPLYLKHVERGPFSIR